MRFIPFGIAIGILAYLASAADELHCHLCFHTDDTETEIPPEDKPNLDDSCKKGNPPNDKFLATCNDAAAGWDTWCMRINFKQKAAASGKEYEHTYRGCTDLSSRMSDGFDEMVFIMKASDIADNLLYGEMLRSAARELEPETEVELSFCNRDRCKFMGDSAGISLKGIYGMTIISSLVVYLFGILI